MKKRITAFIIAILTLFTPCVVHAADFGDLDTAPIVSSNIAKTVVILPDDKNSVAKQVKTKTTSDVSKYIIWFQGACIGAFVGICWECWKSKMKNDK